MKIQIKFDVAAPTEKQIQKYIKNHGWKVTYKNSKGEFPYRRYNMADGSLPNDQIIWQPQYAKMKGKKYGFSDTMYAEKTESLILRLARLENRSQLEVYNEMISL